LPENSDRQYLDVAVAAPDGAVQIVDRLKDVIKTGGEWVSSIGLESLICDVPGVHEAAVIAPRTTGGERRMGFVIRRPDPNVDADSVREYLLARVESNQLSRYAVPEAAASCSSPRFRRPASARSIKGCCGRAIGNRSSDAPKAVERNQRYLKRQPAR
jgi:acyl-CoA synthetase (AMP-forming)/AMP-acid ligase II